MTRTIRLAFAVALQDAGDATRAVELACGLREHRPPGIDVRITFLTHGSRLEPMVTAAGFDLLPCEPALEGRSMNHDLGWDPPQFVGSVALARDLITGERRALAGLRPDAVLHGFWPFANIAARMLDIPVISFLPLPLHPFASARGLLLDVPDQVPLLSRLPAQVRRRVLAAVPGRIKGRLGTTAQTRISEAVMESGWHGPQPRTIFSMLRAGLTVVNDLPEFYPGWATPDELAITGPLFAGHRSVPALALDPRITAALHPEPPVPRILCTMGSSGSKQAMLTALRAVGGRPDDPWNAVFLVSPAVCPLAEAMAQVAGRPGVVVTDEFVPAPVVNAMVDVVVSHGGQGTVQTALACATPVVGVAMQVEQQVNLDHVVRAGAGIRIQAHRWREDTIRRALHTVQADPRYRRAAADLARAIGARDGRRAAAERIWRHLRTNHPDVGVPADAGRRADETDPDRTAPDATGPTGTV